MNRQFARLLLTGAVALLAAVPFAPASAQKTMTADIVVVGAGGSGISAARQAQMLGAKNIVVLEKQPAIGGTTNYCEGMFAVESSLQSRVGIVVTREQAFRTMMDYSHWKANPRLVRAFVDKSAESIEWMKENGVAFKYVAATTPGAPMTWHVFDGLCKKALNTLATKFTESGGKILTKTPGKSLLKEKDRVAGVIAEQEGQALEIRAKAVIIATGGYANSKELLTKYADYPDTIPVGNIGKDGDGIKMAWAVGAAEEGMGVLQTYRPGLPKYLAASNLLAAARQPYLWVDKNGRRFMDELIQTNWPFAGNALVKAGGTAISIFDADTRKFMVETNGVETPVGEFIHVGTKLTKFDDELQKEIAGGNNKAFVVNSIGELAQKLSIDVAILKETIAQNNDFAATRSDGQFFKPGKYMRPVKTPPFYAASCIRPCSARSAACASTRSCKRWTRTPSRSPASTSSEAMRAACTATPTTC